MTPVYAARERRCPAWTPSRDRRAVPCRVAADLDDAAAIAAPARRPATPAVPGGGRRHPRQPAVPGSPRSGPGRRLRPPHGRRTSRRRGPDRRGPGAHTSLTYRRPGHAAGPGVSLATSSRGCAWQRRRPAGPRARPRINVLVTTKDSTVSWSSIAARAGPPRESAGDPRAGGRGPASRLRPRWPTSSREKAGPASRRPSGIPGSVGAAVVTNAGAHGWAMADSVAWVDVLEADGTARRRDPAHLGFAYRTSVLKGDTRRTVLRVALHLVRANPPPSGARVDAHVARRRATQPTTPSAGSMFKNPRGRLRRAADRGRPG